MAIDTTLDPNFSDPAAEPTPWATATAELKAAKTYFLVTVRPDGRPHATTVAGIWLDGAAHFVTGPSERKAKNLAAGNAARARRDRMQSLGRAGHRRRRRGGASHRRGSARPDRRGHPHKYDDYFGMRIVDGRLAVEGATDEGLAVEVRADHRFRVRQGADVRPDPLAVLSRGH